MTNFRYVINNALFCHHDSSQLPIPFIILTASNADVFIMTAVVIPPFVVIAVPEICFRSLTVHVIQDNIARSILKPNEHRLSTGEPQHTTCYLSLFFSKPVITHCSPAMWLFVDFQPSFIYGGSSHQTGCWKYQVEWASCHIRKIEVAHEPGIPGTFFPPPRVSVPDMHHGTCVTHVPWCMPGSLTGGFLWSPWRGKRSRHPRSCATRNFTHLVEAHCSHCLDTVYSSNSLSTHWQPPVVMM